MKIIKLIIIILAVGFTAYYQFDEARDELFYTDSKAWIIIKRVFIFLAISLVVSLLILSAGGDSDASWAPERRWEVGRS